MLLETCISVMTALEAGTRLYDWFSGARLGKNADEALRHRRRDDPDLIKVSDHIFVDRSLREVITPGAAADLQDLRVMREMMEPVATAIGGSVLSSQILHTPSKLREAFRQNPWEVLDDIRPMHRAPSQVRPDWVPIAFLDGGIEYVGFQKKGALPQLFDFEFSAQQAWEPDHAGPAPKATRPPTRRIDTPTRSTGTAGPLDSKVLLQALKDAFRPALQNPAVCLIPKIPEQKLENACANQSLPKGETYVGLVDCTVFGSAKIAILFGLKGVYFVNSGWWSGVPSTRIPYREFVRCQIGSKQVGEIRCGIHSLNSSGCSVPQHDLIAALESLQSRLRRLL